uniref:Ulp1 protease family, C-terminal catalytic domain containing protein n=1 Tax=Solanum tuberosum TaxID=4113 RepID=M1B6B9_SOLTU
MEVENSSPNLNLPESKSPVVKKGQVSSERRTRSQTGAVRREPLKKALNFISKKSRVYGKNQVKKSKKRKRLKNADAGVVALPKRRKGNDDEAMEKALVVDLELKLRNISPTEFEKTTLGLPESTENERVNEVVSGDVNLSDEDTSNPPPQASRKQLKTKRNPPLNNDDWSTELKRLSDGQLELKSEIQMLNKEFASLNDCMKASFTNVFKAIKSLSKKQKEKTASELDGGNDPHDRHGDSNSSEFSNSEDNGGEGQEPGKDSIGDKDNNEKVKEGAIGDVKDGKELGDPVEEVEKMDVSESQIPPDNCAVSDHITPEQLTQPSHSTPVLESPQVNQDDTGVEGSSKKLSNVVDNADYSLLTEFDKWVADEGMKKQSK